MSLVISPTSSESAENEKIKIALIPEKYEVPSRISIYTTPLLEHLKKGIDSTSIRQICLENSKKPTTHICKLLFLLN
jgi:hypothetical protein